MIVYSGRFEKRWSLSLNFRTGDDVADSDPDFFDVADTAEGAVQKGIEFLKYYGEGIDAINAYMSGKADDAASLEKSGRRRKFE